MHKTFLRAGCKAYWFIDMSSRENVEGFLGKAGALEKEYNWIKAAELYKQVLDAIGKKDFLKKGEIQERIGFCFHRATFQAESRKEFNGRIELAIEARLMDFTKS